MRSGVACRDDVCRWPNTLRRVVAMALVVTAAACAGVPRQQLIDFASSFGVARDAGLALYDRLVPILDTGATAAGGALYPRTLGPDSLHVGACEGRYRGIDSLVARCNAFVAVTAYNDALLALAEGAPAQATLRRVDAAFGAVGALATAAAAAPVLSVLQAPVLGGLKAVLGEALKAADRAQLKAVLDRGEPAVQQILQALQADAGRIHSIARAAYVDRLTEIDNRRRARLGPLVQQLNGRAPPATDALRKLLGAAEQRVDPLLARVEPGSSVRQLSALLAPGGQPLTADDVAALTLEMEPVVAAYAEFDAAAAEWPPLRDALASYATLLDELRASLTALRAASDDPLGAGATDLATSIATIRAQGERIREQLNQ